MAKFNFLKMMLLAVVMMVGSVGVFGQTESIIYSTGFENSEGFTAGTNYQTTVVSGPTGQQWTTYYGTPTTTNPITGSQSNQMRLYSNGNIGYTQTNFNLDNVSKVTFNARSNSNSVNVKVEYSIDNGINWLGSHTFILTNTSSNYEYIVSSTGEFTNVRLKFTLVGTAPASGNKQLIIDDIVVYAISTNSNLKTSVNSLSDLSYKINNGPSESKSFALNGNNLSPNDGNINVVSPDGFEISLDDLSFSDNLSIPYTNGLISDETIHVRLKEGQSSGSYNGNVIISGGNAPTLSISVSGNVTLDFCIEENFESIPTETPTSYSNRTWNGAGGTWNATDARTDQTIEGKAITIRAGVITSPKFTNGVGTISFDAKFPYSESSGNLIISVNGVQVGVLLYSEMNGSTPITKVISDINIEGNVVITISANNTRYAIDNLSWTCYTGDGSSLDFRSIKSGDWNEAFSWENSSDGTNWELSKLVPSINASSISIQPNHLITVNEDALGSQVTIQPNGKLTVNNNITFLVENLTIQSDETGSGTVLGIVDGTTTINQAVEGMRSYYLGSPFSTLTSITGITGVATFDVTSDAWTLNTTDPKSAIPAIGNGFLAQVGDAATTHITLSGTLNAENVPFTLVTDATKKFNYVGNPYPSYLNAKQLVEYNSTVEPSLWFRTKTGGAYQFETYNVPADVSIPAASASNNGFIAPLQGFWVKANKTGTAFAFTDAMRTHNTTGVNLPLKAPKVSENKILRLQVINGSEFDETVVLFNSNAQNGFDKYDASKMMNTGANALNIYTKLGSDKLVLNSQSAIQYDSEIPLEVKTAKIGTFTIKANEFSNFGNFDKVQLKNEAGLITDLTLGDYTFTTSAENATTRFALIFPSNAPTGTDNFEMKSARVMALDNRIIIDTNDSFLGTTVSVYNQVGQRVAMQTINSNKTEINGLLSAGVYLVKLNNQSFKVLLK